jgi:hypothetical protein
MGCAVRAIEQIDDAAGQHDGGQRHATHEERSSTQHATEAARTWRPGPQRPARARVPCRWRAEARARGAQPPSRPRRQSAALFPCGSRATAARRAARCPALPCRTSPSRGSGSTNCCRKSSESLPTNGRRPANISNSTRPAAYTSLRASTASPVTCSGAMYAGFRRLPAAGEIGVVGRHHQLWRGQSPAA